MKHTRHLPVIKLKKNEERRIRAGHPWIYSNEIDVDATPIKALEQGQMIRVVDSREKFLAYGYLNPKTLIAIRVLSLDAELFPDFTWLHQKLKSALDARNSFGVGPYYRWVFGEGDGLPGLVIDRYGDIVVIQLNTAGMQRQKQAIAQAIQTLVHPKGMVWRLDSPSRTLEGLEHFVEFEGEISDWTLIRENGIEFEVPLKWGQKTGWFYDHRSNRAFLKSWIRGKRVLDLFSYLGAWGISAAVWGASEVLCIDSSKPAVQAIARQAQRNRVQVQAQVSDAFVALEELYDQGERFDCIILDPPALIKRKKHKRRGFKAYQKLNGLALRVLNPGGVLASASCSYHLSRSELRQILAKWSKSYPIHLFAQGGLSWDHPQWPAFPEGDYLKIFWARLLFNAH